jgi:hypothetical protein
VPDDVDSATSSTAVICCPAFSVNFAPADLRAS